MEGNRSRGRRRMGIVDEIYKMLNGKIGTYGHDGVSLFDTFQNTVPMKK